MFFLFTLKSRYKFWTRALFGSLIGGISLTMIEKSEGDAVLSSNIL